MRAVDVVHRVPVALALTTAVTAWVAVQYYGDDQCVTRTHPIVEWGLIFAIPLTITGIVGLTRHWRDKSRRALAAMTLTLSCVALLPYVLSAMHVLPQFWDGSRCLNDG